VSADNDPMAEIRASFFIECDELLESLQDGLQIIDDGENDDETINIVFRAVHSIKGGAGAFGLEALVRFAHRFETALDEVRGGKMSVGPDELRLFFSCADHLADLVRISRDEGEEEENIDFAPTGLSFSLDLPDISDAGPDLDLPDLADLPPPEELMATDAERTFVISCTPTTELFETGNEMALLLRALKEQGTAEITLDASKLPEFKAIAPENSYLSWSVRLTTKADKDEIASIFEFVEGLCTLDIEEIVPEGAVPADPEPEPAPPPMLEPEPLVQEAIKAEPVADPEPAAPSKTPPPETAKKPASAGGPSAAKAVVRVDLDRIERLVNLVGELVINQAMLSQSLEQSGLSPHSDAMNGLEEFQRLTRDIQDSVMMIRAQPVKSLFQRMSRIVREASATIGKNVRLHTSGEATEVDKTVIERLADPLTHMIRNAVDHGLESSERRLETGKSEQGNVTLSAAHRSGRVVIEISDDGAGINRPKVRQIAVDKGLIPSDAQLSETEIDNLLFLPGFSTASVVSDLSGRGVGMDVVRTAIQALGGRITITSVPGEGTTFSISLPLTLAVLDGMVINVSDETLVLPLSIVIETLTLGHSDVQTVRPGAYVVEVRDAILPVFDLGAALGYRPLLDDFEGRIVLVIALDDGNKAALLIDDIQDQRQVVIKGLDDSCYRAPGIAAATILGDGQIALILDPSDIITTPATPGFSEQGCIA